ncbi:MAG TPA: hypothetical protein VFQ85_10290 [Mycobacteriales bacterium]|nr:hypothetical protein [Mycobacteriales bacterium]
MAEYEDTKREREELDAYLSVLARRLGISADDATADEPVGEPGLANIGPGGLTNDVLTLVYENEFYGKSMPKAAEMVLLRWSPPGHTRPLKTTQLVAALRKGGLAVADAKSLYRALYGASKFHPVGGGLWGLRSWYPDSVLSRAPKTGADEAGGVAEAEPQAPTTDLPSQPAAGEGSTPEKEAAAS